MRGPVPRRCQGLRGTGPRATVCWRFFSRSGLLRWASSVPGYRSARACPSPMSRIAGDRPPRYGVLTFFCPVRDCCGGPVASPVTVGRGPVPRRCQGLRGTGPALRCVGVFLSRSGLLRWASSVPGYRSARACPSPVSRIAGDRPPRYGVLTFFCPVRDCCGGPVASPVTVGRGPVPRRCQGLRGTGPRATVCWRFFVPFGIVAVGQ